MNNIKTICLTTVASRNLTTLFGAICMLHPSIAVLNHFPYINIDNTTNFLLSYSEEKVNNFIKRAIKISNSNIKIPGEGGSITQSHAFKSIKIQNIFSTIQKNEINSIVWKDSSRNQLLLNKNIETLIKANNKFRFVLTVRNPMDCAVSNCKKGYNKFFKSNNKEGVLEELFQGYQWFLNLKNKYNNLFFTIFEYDMTELLLEQLQIFLSIPNDKTWITNVLKVWEIRKIYSHNEKFKNKYNQLIKQYISSKNDAAKFEQFI